MDRQVLFAAIAIAAAKQNVKIVWMQWKAFS